MEKKRIIITLCEDIQKELIDNNIDLYSEIKKTGLDFDVTFDKHPDSPQGSKDIIQIIEIITASASLIVPIAVEIIKRLKPMKTTEITEKKYSDGTMEKIISIKESIG